MRLDFYFDPGFRRRLISLIAPPSIAPLMRARLGACRGGELRPHRLRHPPETRQWGARSQLIAAVFTKKKGCRLGRGSPRFKMPPTIGGMGTGAGGVIITRPGRHRSSAAQVPYVALGKQLAHRGC